MTATGGNFDSTDAQEDKWGNNLIIRWRCLSWLESTKMKQKVQVAFRNLLSESKKVAIKLRIAFVWNYLNVSDVSPFCWNVVLKNTKMIRYSRNLGELLFTDFLFLSSKRRWQISLKLSRTTGQLFTWQSWNCYTPTEAINCSKTAGNERVFFLLWKIESYLVNFIILLRSAVIKRNYSSRKEGNL